MAVGQAGMRLDTHPAPCTCGSHSECGIRNGMKPLSLQPSLVEQAYEAILDATCDGTLAAGTHLVQEQLAERLGVSRHPIQQALLLLRSDGVVQDAGRRGLIVAPLDLAMVRHRYQVRAALDVLAARLAAGRCAGAPELAALTKGRGERIVAEGIAAVAGGAVREMIAHDVAFHGFVYEASGNPVLGPTAQPHWSYLRRVMGEVLRHAEPPAAIWQQHRGILDAIVRGEVETAGELALRHVEMAAEGLERGLEATG